jgi:hypothetical protein
MVVSVFPAKIYKIIEYPANQGIINVRHETKIHS